MKHYSTDDVMTDLKARVGKSTQLAVARELGVSAQHINDLLNGRRKLTERIAVALGFSREVIFRRVA
jgi:plasmid maintenance system antidote protein VapI